jgi:SAM-dependent methyltransferase
MKTVLDLCCGVGGAAAGYQQAGYHVTGVDLFPQPDYCGDEFVQDDALEYCLKNGNEFDFIHASWPCQASSALTKGTNRGRRYPQLIPLGRAIMQATKRPWVIENVSGSPIRKDLTLCGEMFGLSVIRHRHFEFSPGTLVYPAIHIGHRGRVAGYRHGEYFDGPYFAVYGDGGGKGSISDWQDAMSIHWTTNRKSLAEAIPPAYTRYIGEMLKK